MKYTTYLFVYDAAYQALSTDQHIQLSMIKLETFITMHKALQNGKHLVLIFILINLLFTYLFTYFIYLFI